MKWTCPVNGIPDRCHGLPERFTGRTLLPSPAGKHRSAGITDDYKIGYKSPYRHLDRLTRVYEYMGPAWYQREIEIPAAWKGKRIFLYFETYTLAQFGICRQRRSE